MEKGDDGLRSSASSRNLGVVRKLGTRSTSTANGMACRVSHHCTARTCPSDVTPSAIDCKLTASKTVGTMDSSPAIDREEIDRVLRAKRKQREAKACYPCRQRKVKCDHGHPCKTCRKRGHPQICAYDLEQQTAGRKDGIENPAVSVAGHPPSPPRSLLPGRVSELSTAQESSRGQYPSGQGRKRGRSTENESGLNGSEDGEAILGSREYVFSGDNSVVSIVRLRAQHQDRELARDVGPVLGLQNTYRSYPFMDVKTAEDRWAALLQILPRRQEVLTYFHFYRISLYPFNPILVDIEQFELDMCAYMNAYAAGEFADPQKISDRWSTKKSVELIGLILAVLASGAHFSDLSHSQRSKLCQDFARRSFQALRLANFLFRPSLDIIQALLLLGNTLQNTGQSDAAWAMLGTTIRLSQTMGLHSETSVAHMSETFKSKAKTLWANIVWQDALLSLCHDRPPAMSRNGWTPDESLSTGMGLPYTAVMHRICRLSVTLMAAQDAGRQDYGHCIEALATVDDMYRRVLPHLQARENCQNLHQHLEHLALKMHICFFVSFICRPAIKSTPMAADESHYELLRQRARESLVDAAKAFLDFQALSTVPLRTWSMIHTVLSSTLLLCIWEETRNNAECRDLQQRVIEVFSAEESMAKDDPASSSGSDNSQWLSERHIRALVSLRNAFSETSDAVNAVNDAQQAQRPPEPPRGDEINPDNVNGAASFSAYNAFPPTFDYRFPNGSFVDTLHAADTSPISYLDSIMNVPFFDFSQDSQFV
ncbi:hypothetical protein VTN77DRAFT_7815 [Rasamsonia byssochlamydoides]|uniref:uncharacterized protein n=1 Tax=Rasamsonia byssochlamydoides TaxID=89139 RepID=UPI0037437AA7